MLDNILNVINEHTENVHSVTDIFSGTGSVAKFLKAHGYTVFSNDILYLSYVMNKGTIELNQPISDKIHKLIKHLNSLTLANSPWFNLDNAFIFQNYSPHDGCERMYFQCENAIKIDLIRQEIERHRSEVSEQEYFYLLSLLLNAVPYVSNITGTYGAYLKFWDKRTYNPLFLEEVEIPLSNINCTCYNMDASVLAQQMQSDLVYLDPPYNGRQYLPNYHILETIARYDNPEIKGVTGMRVDPEKMSDFCKKGSAKHAFRRLLVSLNCRYIILSYNNEALLSTEDMAQIVKEAGIKETFRLYEYDYRRYKNKIPNKKAGLKEQLYFIEKRR